MGTKAGLVPLHTWLPRAHPIAPAHVSALMSGVMIKMAVYGLVRVLVEWLGDLPTWYGVVVVVVGGASAVIGVVYAIFQHELKRLLAFHSIENVGIIVLGLGACLLLHARGADDWAGVALAAALLHTLNHAVFKGLLFLGAGAFEKAAGSLEIDRLGGLLQRMPWTGGAFLVGAMAIAGLPPLNGFASEWLTLQSLLAVPANGGVAEGLAGALALGALAATAALAVLCFVKVVGLVLLGRPRRARIEEAVEAPFPMRAAVVVLAVACVVLGIVPGAARRAARRPRALADGRRAERSRRGAVGRRAAGARDRARPARRDRRSSSPPEVAGEPRPRRAGRADSSSGPSSRGRAPGSRSRSGSCSRPCCVRPATSRSRCAAASSRRCATRGTSRTSSTRTSTARSRGWGSGRPHARGACRAGA